MLNPNEFLSELYSRLDSINPTYNEGQIALNKFKNNEFGKLFIEQYKTFLPTDKNAKILDIGVGEGWFASLCFNLGYKHIELADFGCSMKFSDVQNNLDEIVGVHDIETSIKNLLLQEKFLAKFDFIHLSHVIEHIPKYDLIDTIDSLNGALRNEGELFLRAPNMLGPNALASLYCTGGHEYGFIPSNLRQFLLISNFEDIKFHKIKNTNKTFGQFLGSIIRRFYIFNAKLKYRIFEGSYPETVEPELVVSSKKKMIKIIDV